MTSQNISNFLKQLRKTSGLSANKVVEDLQQYNIAVSAKTLYGYESGLSMPNADVFVALCKIYKCDNPLNLFETANFDTGEIRLIEKYRSLDEFGRESVDVVIERELQRFHQIMDAVSSREAERYIAYYYKLASAGTGQIIFDMPPSKSIPIPATEENRNVDYAIGVNGDSMEPDFYDGDVLLVQITHDVEIGEIGIFQVDGECYVKKRGEKELISINEKYDNIPLNETASCMGKVVGKL